MEMKVFLWYVCLFSTCARVQVCVCVARGSEHAVAKLSFGRCSEMQVHFKRYISSLMCRNTCVQHLPSFGEERHFDFGTISFIVRLNAGLREAHAVP